MRLPLQARDTMASGLQGLELPAIRKIYDLCTYNQTHDIIWTLQGLHCLSSRFQQADSIARSEGWKE